MGFSDPDNKPWTAEKILQLNPTSVLDIGAGAGVYYDIVRRDLPASVVIDAIEAWQPYVDQFNLVNRYNNVFVGDVREYPFEKQYDLVICGDILEHMSESDALKVWDNVSKIAKYAIISIPIIHYHQDAINGNPYEVHVEEDWSMERTMKSFKGIIEYQKFAVTGVFIAKFDN